MKQSDRNLSGADRTFELGEILGQRRAFGAVAGRCSAADAACIKRLRDDQLFKDRSETWEEFCPKYLGMGKSNANRLIRELDELGPEYFQLAQLTRISAQEYRALAPAVRDGSLHRDGEVIALIPENSEKVSAAVAELRRAAKAGAAPGWTPPLTKLPSLQARGQKLAEEYAEILKLGLSVEHRGKVEAAMEHLHHLLFRVKLDNR